MDVGVVGPVKITSPILVIASITIDMNTINLMGVVTIKDPVNDRTNIRATIDRMRSEI